MAAQGRIDEAVMLALHAQGSSTRAIAAHFGVKSPAVTRRLNLCGVKLVRGGQGKNADRRDQLAELVAESGSVRQAAMVMGLSETRAFQLWKDIRDGLGWQAQ